MHMFKRIFTAAFFVMGMFLTGQAQTLVTIDSIQTTVSATNDTSVLHGQYVKVRGVLVTDPANWWQAPTRYNFWIQEKGQSGTKTGIQIYLSDGTKASSTGVSGLQVGDEIEIIGTVGYYNGAKQVVLDTNTTVTVISAGNQVMGPDTVAVGTFNDAQNLAQPTGEPWEASYVAIKNVTVISVAASATRGFFDVQDAAGNVMTIYDNFKTLNPGNGFTKPSVGDFYKSIAGILVHYKNTTGTNKYEITPFKSSDLVLGSASPVVQSMTRSVPCPKSTDPVKITATVTLPTGTPLSSVEVKYGLSPTDSASNTLTMTETTPGTWEATIPAQTNGTFVNYFVVATDTAGRTGMFPNYQPKCYTVNDNGCRIHDIQKTSNIMFIPTQYFTSGYEDLTVTDVVGVVSASANDLGYVYLQEPGYNAWGGIQLIGDPGIFNYQTGDSVRVTGIVKEYYGFTQIEVTSHAKLGTTTATPVVLPISTLVSPNDDQTYNTEPYEGMLVRFEDPGLRVVQVKADTVYNSGKGDYRVGLDPLDPLNGVLVIAGRQTNSVFSSLNVSYVNDSMWANTDGVMNTAISVCVVTDTTTMDAIQGIVGYQWRDIKLMPRSNSDFENIKGTTCKASSVKLLNKARIKIYPNPAVNSFTLQTDKPVSISVQNLLGQTLLRKSLNRTETVDISELPQGIYLVSVFDTAGNLIGTDKLIVK